jgi:hypothetical protein
MFSDYGEMATEYNGVFGSRTDGRVDFHSLMIAHCPVSTPSASISLDFIVVP